MIPTAAQIGHDQIGIAGHDLGITGHTLLGMGGHDGSEYAVARLTGLNRSTVTALYRNTATRIELPAVDLLCALFRCSVGDLLEYVADEPGRAT